MKRQGCGQRIHEAANGWTGTIESIARLAPSGDSDADRAVDVKLREVRAFGYTLGVSDRTVVGGSWKRAYIFVELHAGWQGTQTETQKLSASAAPSAARIDILALDGETLMMGQPNKDYGRMSRQGVRVAIDPLTGGAAYVFVRHSSR